MNLEDLRERRRREREQDSLQSLPATFYADAADYLRELKAAREEAAERAADPYGDPEVRRLTDELQTAESVVESLYERRVGKVVKHASFAAADMPHEREGLTDEERALFDDLVARIRENRSRVLDTLAGEGETTAVDAAATETAETPDRDEPAPSTDAAEPASDRPSAEAAVADRDDPAGMLADAMGGGSESSQTPDAAAETDESPATPPQATDEDGRPPAEPPAEDDPRPTGGSREGTDDVEGDDAPDPDERTTVRITADVGEIYGVDDRDYDLAAEDVVDLPADNAAPLIEKEAAERL